MKKKILITAGSTKVPIDKVRVISNIFKGRTGTDIAHYFVRDGRFDITLITSNPTLAKAGPTLRVIPYHTYNDLKQAMETAIRSGGYDAIIHSAAVSDYLVDGVYVSDESNGLLPVENNKKISSSHECLYLKLSPTEKLIDKIREPWGFKGFLVKFKLQVGITDEELLGIADESREHSSADLIVANCLEWSKLYAYVVGMGWTEKVSREKIGSAIARRFPCEFFSE